MALTNGWEKRGARVEMLPLLDVIFLVLVFFIYAMLDMVVLKGLPVDLPFLVSAMPDKQMHLNITIQKDNQIFLEKTPVDLDTLLPVLQDRLANQARPQSVLISGDEESGLGVALKVMDVIRQAGLHEVTFQCLPSQP